MDLFGPKWTDHAEKIAKNWKERVKEDDLVLLAGDISWAMRTEEVKPDLEWIDQLPGTKVMIRGNHDYWWGSLSKISSLLPPSCHLIQNNSFNWKDVTIGGARLWDSESIKLANSADIFPTFVNKETEFLENKEESEKIFQRELLRLEMSLKSMNPEAKFRIAMTHYPPLSFPMTSSPVTELLEKYRVNACVFGHIHSLKDGVKLYGSFQGINYYLTACDYLDFTPILIRGQD